MGKPKDRRWFGAFSWPNLIEPNEAAFERSARSNASRLSIGEQIVIND
jgi:hypothetical protein